MRQEIAGQDGYQEGVVHVLNDPVDGSCQFPGLIERAQVPEVPAVLAASQRVLDVLADGGINIPPGGLVIPEGGVLGIHFRVVEGQFSSPKRAAVTDVLVDLADSQQTAVFPIGDEGGVDHLRPVVELLAERKPESQGIRAGQDDLHALGSVNIGQEGGGVDEVPHQRDLVQKHITEPQGAEPLHIPVQVRNRILLCGLDIGCFCRLLGRHVQHSLAEQCCFPSPPEAEEKADTVAPGAVQIGVQLAVAVPLLPASDILGQGQQGGAGHNVGLEFWHLPHHPSGSPEIAVLSSIPQPGLQVERNSPDNCLSVWLGLMHLCYKEDVRPLYLRWN